MLLLSAFGPPNRPLWARPGGPARRAGCGLGDSDPTAWPTMGRIPALVGMFGSKLTALRGGPSFCGRRRPWCATRPRGPTGAGHRESEGNRARGGGGGKRCVAAFVDRGSLVHFAPGLCEQEGVISDRQFSHPTPRAGTTPRATPLAPSGTGMAPSGSVVRRPWPARRPQAVTGAWPSEPESPPPTASRVVAYLIDFAVVFVGLIVLLILAPSSVRSAAPSEASCSSSATSACSGSRSGTS